MTGIEPALSAWEADVLPLNYTRRTGTHISRPAEVNDTAPRSPWSARRARPAALGLSQTELAKAAGVHVRQIARYEAGEPQPALPVADRLADALGISLAQLAGKVSYEALGATRWDHQQERGYDFWVMREPWGNEFCVLQPEFPDLLS